ncbi:MAG TPA: tetraacyldisaccharide 4'-kinase [Steroidobacteraceae bacterium]|nr:tetraacyldisaccharide 4'-kinase [Steroidobacteraceae bacterium]
MPERFALRRRVERAWYGTTPNLLLRPLAGLYGIGMGLRRQAYRAGMWPASHPGVPTIVVGNLTVGGTGKTPLVLWLADRLRRLERRPGILLRGYGGSARTARLVHAGDDAAVVGDEAVLLARRTGCAVAVGAHRAAAAALLVRGGCNVLIADDGLQHLALRRDLEIIMVDGSRGFGNGALLPAGPLREPPSRLRPGACVVLHGEDRHGVLPSGLAPLRMQLEPLPLRQLPGHGECGLDALGGNRVHAVAGIGHPQRFFAQLRGLGLDPAEHTFPDHHRFTARDLAFDDGLPVVMTEKDAVRCEGLAAGRRDLFYLPVTAVLPEADATRLIERVLAIGRD